MSITLNPTSGPSAAVAVASYPSGSDQVPGSALVAVAGPTGASTHRRISTNTTNAVSVKASAGQVYAITVTNANAAARYLKLYNQASAPTVGADTPLLVLLLPAGSTQHLTWPHGLPCPTGIAFALTTGAADSDTGAVGANDHSLTLTYA